MIRPINHDEHFLQQKSLPATRADAQVIVDLMDTLRANTGQCVGMAANMIGVKKCIIVFSVGPLIVPMINPKKQSFEGWTAQIIQHEIDHCDGILIQKQLSEIPEDRSGISLSCFLLWQRTFLLLV